MTTSLYDLAEQVDGRLDDFAFAERTAKVETALTATQVLPIKRAIQHETQHKKLSALFWQNWVLTREFEFAIFSAACQKSTEKHTILLYCNNRANFNLQSPV